MTDRFSLTELKQAALDRARASDWDAAADLLDRVLAAAPNDLGSLLLLGDVSHSAGNLQAASDAYRAALALAAQAASLPDAVRAGLQRAQQRLAEYASEYAARLDRLIPPAERSARFNQSLDILLGRQPVYLQEPRRYYFPGLPQIQIYDTAGFDWVPELEAKTPEIQAELRAVLADDQASFRPYLERGTSHLAAQDHELLDNDDWSAFYLWRDGKKVESNCARCPVTTAAVERAPLDFADGKCPSVLFSVLKPGAHIPPHNGMVNTRLICHLPLIVPGPAWLRVGSETHHWQEGRIVIFDDSIEHEAKNEADETRIVLLFDIWRPELTEQERREVATLLGAINSFNEG
ncbi:MAG: aspartyl/asparaginyl beta-hydroxylase domain-containing protein [Hyphomonas sp.]|nr:aspartyl/asparaginyl beta-hydroxylase domain-containing protein [Hyphomonas sp.]